MSKTKVINIPVDKIAAVEKLLGRKIAVNQTPRVMIRATDEEIAKIRKVLK